MNGNYTNTVLSLFDITGKLMDTRSYKNQSLIQLNYSHLAKGMYQLQLNTENGNYFSKIIIE